ncbi:copper-binding protein [Granulosicoccus sp.]|nr:copper-binding protein [Granulosicoccus sp.]
MKKSIVIAVSVLLVSIFTTSFVHADSHEMTKGEVRRVDVANGKITLRHEEIKSLDMPSMSMVFTVKDPKLLADLKRGDKVEFIAVEENGKLFVTEIKTTE